MLRNSLHGKESLKDFKELNDRELKDRELKTKEEIRELYLNQLLYQ